MDNAVSFHKVTYIQFKNISFILRLWLYILGNVCVKCPCELVVSFFNTLFWQNKTPSVPLPHHQSSFSPIYDFIVNEVDMKYDVSHICSLKFSSGHNKKGPTNPNEINFNNSPIYPKYFHFIM